MARKMERLTALKVRAAKAGMHADGGCLWLQVRGDAKSWVFRYAIGGVERYMGLGPVTDVSLADAREAARQHRETLRHGGDPIIVRDAALAEAKAKASLAEHGNTTFRDCAERMLTSHEGAWRNPKHRAQWRQSL